MQKSQWDELGIHEKITEILRAAQTHNPEHHFGPRPYLTPYQIAIQFSIDHPADCDCLGLPIGGKGAGQKNSLAQYLAKELSHRIKEGKITNIEGAFLHRSHLLSLQYAVNDTVVEASSGQAYDLSMFRLVEM